MSIRSNRWVGAPPNRRAVIDKDSAASLRTTAKDGEPSCATQSDGVWSKLSGHRTVGIA